MIRDVDGHSLDSISNSINETIKSKDKPTLICCKTKIGYGSPNKEGKESSHGSPLEQEETALTKKYIGWDHSPFVIPDYVYDAWNNIEKGTELENNWNEKFGDYREKYPKEAADLERRIKSKLPENWLEKSREFIKDCNEKEDIATRKASQRIL